MQKKDVLFVLSIDTEEEWLWDEEFPQDDCSVKNITKLPEFNEFCKSLSIRPTYFVDYAVAQDKLGQKVLSQFASEKSAEIGAHLHPWCNPPFFGKTREAESHVINLPKEQVEQKLDALTDLIHRNIGVRPKSFRSGRWGIDGNTLELLASRGFSVDSSIYPFYQNDFFSCLGAPTIPYWPSFTYALSRGSQRTLAEIPITAGFSVSRFNTAERIHGALSKPPFSWFKMVGALWHTKLLRKIYLSPELTNSANMNTLVDNCLKNDHQVIHMYLHSSSLIDGATGLLDVDEACERIKSRIAAVIKHLGKQRNIKFCTISEAAIALKNASHSRASDCSPEVLL